MDSKKTAFVCLSLVISLLLSASLAGCQQAPRVEEDPSLAVLPAEAAVFAPYREVPVDFKPLVEPYRAAADLSNVTNRDSFQFSAEALRLLTKNSFVVVPSPAREFFSVYEINRYDMIPNFVTTDAMLHNYHLYFSHLLRTLEKDILREELRLLTESLLAESQTQYQILKGTGWENAAKRNVAFFAVAARLIDPRSKIPSFVRGEVNAELSLIADHQEYFQPSPIMSMGNSNASLADILHEDYTQYAPRGHYTESDELKTYFQTMMWLGRMTFRASNEDETKSAALITLLLSRQANYDRWNLIYEPTNFFVGKSDDLGLVQYHQLLNETYGRIPFSKELTENTGQWNAFLTGVKELDPPAINSIPIFDESIQPDRDEVIKGFRVMGQRFTPDASIFQRLVYREVGVNSINERRMLPNGLDIPAAMGSRHAYSTLEEMRETDYQKYPENMAGLQKDIASLDTGVWTQNLYWTWLYTLKPLTEPKGKGYPAFMHTKAWAYKQLETYLGSWAELKHDTLLYAKQSYAEMGGGWFEEDDRGYVEPNPVVYARLAALTRMTIDGLQSRGLLKETTAASLKRMESLALRLKEISEKELAQQPLSEDDYELIQSFGGQLEHFWLEALGDGSGGHPEGGVYENPSALIADVATNPDSSTVLEAGTGFVSHIYAIVPVEGTLRIAKGAVYSYYEFPWSAGDRLTDEKWKEMLENEETPVPPPWTRIYTDPERSAEW